MSGIIQYPIYSFTVRWIQDKTTCEMPNHGLPEGRIWNSAGFSKMYKEEPTTKDLDIECLAWTRTLKEVHKSTNIEIFSVQYKLLKKDSWCLTWFSHYTIDVGQTDEEVIDSFHEYVARIKNQAFKEGKEPCLMGAEDTWRWHSTDENGERDKAPCRCKFCKEAGIIRIDH